MGKKERIAHFEDDPSMIAMVEYAFEGTDHEIVATALTLEEALALIPQLREKGVTCVITDGNLTERANSGNDGLKITATVKLVSPEMKVVVLSGQPYGYGDRFVLKSAFRRNQPSGNIVGVVTDL